MKSINPYDLGKTTNSLRSVKMTDLLQEARRKFKLEFVNSTLIASGVEVKLTYSRTRYGGKRVWFVCPLCEKKRGVIYQDHVLACRVCLGLKYRKQRYKGMIEIDYIR